MSALSPFPKLAPRPLKAPTHLYRRRLRQSIHLPVLQRRSYHPRLGGPLAAYEPDETGWKNVPWFGRIYDYGDKWIYHEQHGFLYGLGFDETEIWFYDIDMGWVWTGKSMYPKMYRGDPGLWYFYVVGTDDPRWFYDYSSPDWTVLNYEDADEDGMLDIWEMRHFGDTSRDGTRDYDRDGLLDLEEYLLGTEGNHPDSDSDGFTDGWEKTHGYDPTDSASPDDDIKPNLAPNTVLQ